MDIHSLLLWWGLSGRQGYWAAPSGGRGRRSRRGAKALRLLLAAAATVVLSVAVSLPTESASLISALVPPAHHRAPADPRSYVGMYQSAAASCPGMSWTVLAGIGEVETHHGRLTARSPAGAIGPMQFLPATWHAYATDGDHNGAVDVHSPADAIATAARYLCANGAGDRATLATAIWNYNHSWAYVARVLEVSTQLTEAEQRAA